MRFLGLHSAGEGPHLVPISLKFGSPSRPHFEKSGSPGLVGTALRLPQVLIKPRKIAGVHWWQGGLLSLVNIKSTHPPLPLYDTLEWPRPRLSLQTPASHTVRKILWFLKNSQIFGIFSEFRKILRILENSQTQVFLSQVMSPLHSDQMFQWPQVSRIALLYGKSKS